ncbi:hypothetical protein Hanom_Chr07g00624661 [Helianthus anomalus]
MVFGKNTSQGDSETHISETKNNYIDIEDEVQQSNPNSTSTTSGSQGNEKTEDLTKPVNDEVVFHGAGKIYFYFCDFFTIKDCNSKNPGGSKQWTCKHCQGRFTSTYTRIHVHFFGPPVGKKAEIKRCPAVLKDRELFEKLSKKVREAENSGGVSKCLKNSVLSKNAPRKRMEEAFGILERNAVDLKIIRGLCANEIPFNVLRNPHFIETISAIKKCTGRL